MLFNSYEFLFLFLPIVLAGFCLLCRWESITPRLVWLTAASLFFYGWWNPPYLALIVVSILGNYGIALRIGKTGGKWKKALAGAGITGNLAILGYFKYANFFVDNLAAIFAADLHRSTIILPLAISFFTFQQVAFLVDTCRAGRTHYTLLEYAYFVSFFPQLIAGPIVHHAEVMPQLGQLRPTARGWSLGFTLLILGLAKKLILADSVIPSVTGLFLAAEQGAMITLADAWLGSLAYAMQLYFDFSGYSDMAIGLGWLFGIVLPVNFNSPYQAASISEFWRRWHITLSRFLRDYLYIPLGGNRRGPLRQSLNLFATMLLGGMWHGAGWTFIFWGGLHGTYLTMHHAWCKFIEKTPLLRFTSTRLWTFGGWAITFTAVLIGWVFFRATSFGSALNIVAAMAGLAGFGAELFHVAGEHVPLILAAAGIAWLAPNTQQIVAWMENEAAAPAWWQFSPSLRWACLLGLLGVVSIMKLSSVSEFLYFQF